MTAFPLYPISDDEAMKVANAFRYHAPIPGQEEKYEELRDSGSYLATRMLNLCPPSRERSLAMTKLEESIMWANAAIARNETVKPQE